VETVGEGMKDRLGKGWGRGAKRGGEGECAREEGRAGEGRRGVGEVESGEDDDKGRSVGSIGESGAQKRGIAVGE